MSSRANKVTWLMSFGLLQYRVNARVGLKRRKLLPLSLLT